MILADLHDGKRFWKRETRTYSLTSGPRSPTKIECSGPRSSRLECVSHTRLHIQPRSLPSISQATARCPVQLEWPVGVGYDGAVESQGLGGSLSALKIDEAVAGIAAGDQYVLVDVSETRKGRLTRKICRGSSSRSLARPCCTILYAQNSHRSTVQARPSCI